MRHLKSVQFFVIAISMFFITSCANQNTVENTYTNPVIRGDFPDPSIIRVGETYYAVGTSCDFAPNYPIYESTDLINWKRISSVFNEPPAWSSDDFWAPELFYMNGTFYVYYTTKRKDNRIACIGVATTTDIRKGFTDHGIIIEWGEEAIDAYVYKDDDDKLYMTWKAYGLTEGRDIEILASELSSDGLSLVGDHWTLTDHTKDWHGSGDEGQCIVKRNGYYFMLYSIGGCCDNRCDYRVVVSRSKNLRSGWEQLPEPILQGGETWKCTGHGTLVTTPDNRDFYLYHSYNATDFEYIGRQGMLDEIVWDEETNWPKFKNGNTPSLKAKVPFSGTQQIIERIWSDDFSTDKSLAFWEWDVNIPKPSVELSNGILSMSSSYNGISFIGLRPKAGDYSLTAEVLLSNENGGIGIYSNQENSIVFTANQSNLLVYKIENGEKEILSKKEIENDKSVFLKYESVDGRYYKFFWSENETDWNPIMIQGTNQFDAKYIAQWGFSPRVGFILDGETTSTSSYSSLQIDYK